MDEQLDIEVVCWGPCWAEEIIPATPAPSAASSGASSLFGNGHIAAHAPATASSVAAARLLVQVLRLQQRGEQLAKQGQAGAAAQVLQQALSVSQGSGTSGSGAAVLGPKHVLRMRLCAALLKAAIDAGDRWEVALQAARALVPMYELVYPKVRGGTSCVACLGEV